VGKSIWFGENSLPNGKSLLGICDISYRGFIHYLFYSLIRIKANNETLLNTCSRNNNNRPATKAKRLFFVRANGMLNTWPGYKVQHCSQNRMLSVSG
jgi:hypothetical protein